MTLYVERGLQFLSIISGIWVLFFGSQSLFDVMKYAVGVIRGTISRGSKFTMKRSTLLRLGLGCGVLIVSLGILYILSLPTVPPKDFAVTSLQNGAVIQNQDVPLTIKGTYSSAGSGQVWVLLEDGRGQFYLQNPAVKFLPQGEWVAVNINPGPGIVQIDFVQVTREGNDEFQQKVNSNDFNAFSSLPVGSTTLLTISITSRVTT